MGGEATIPDKKEEERTDTEDESRPWVSGDPITKFEDLLDMIGTDGFKNYKILFCAMMTSVISPLHIISYQFLGAIPEHWCHLAPLVEANWTTDQILALSLPDHDESGVGQYCLAKDYNYTKAADLGYEKAMDSLDLISLNNGGNITCDRRDFNQSAPITVSVEWDLVCNHKWIYSFTQTAIMIGMLLGSITLGYLLDRFGRKRVLMFASPLCILIGFVTAASPNIEFYIMCKVLIASMGMAFFMAGVVISLEICSTKQRSYVGSYSGLPWSVGYMAMPGIAYLVQPWRWMQVALTVPAFLLIVAMWVIPESPRWLMLQGRYEECLAILTDIAKANKRDLPSTEILMDALKTIRSKENVSKSEENLPFKKKLRKFLLKLTAVIRIKQFRSMTAIVFFCWFSVSLVYYGISLNSTNLSTNKYIYTFLGGLSEMPSLILMAPAIARFGRPKVLWLTYYVCAICLFIVMILILAGKDDISALMIFLSLLGKFAISMTFQIVWMFTAELYPTEYRSIALGESSVCARFGSGISPFINDILGENEANKWAPSALFGIVSLIAGSISILLPDTNNKVLKETAESKVKTSLEEAIPPPKLTTPKEITSGNTNIAYEADKN